MEWMVLPLKRYADFSGRSRRKEYWMFTLFTVLVALALVVVILGTGMSLGAEGDGEMGAGGMIGLGLFVLFYLAILIPSIAVQVRRFHDQDKSGWFVLLNFVPYVGSLIVFIMMCLEGTRGENRFGPDPKGMGEDIGNVFR